MAKMEKKQFTYGVSFESDIHPVETIRGTLEAIDAADAIRRAVFRAENERTGKTRFRSLVVVVEEAAVETAAKSPNKIGDVRAGL